MHEANEEIKMNKLKKLYTMTYKKNQLQKKHDKLDCRKITNPLEVIECVNKKNKMKTTIKNLEKKIKENPNPYTKEDAYGDKNLLWETPETSVSTRPPINSKKETLDKQIDEEIKKAEDEINQLRKDAPLKINKIAIETASELTKKLIGAEVNNSSISAIVDDLSKKNGDKYYGN